MWPDKFESMTLKNVLPQIRIVLLYSFNSWPLEFELSVWMEFLIIPPSVDFMTTYEFEHIVSRMPMKVVEREWILIAIVFVRVLMSTWGSDSESRDTYSQTNPSHWRRRWNSGSSCRWWWHRVGLEVMVGMSHHLEPWVERFWLDRIRYELRTKFD